MTANAVAPLSTLRPTFAAWPVWVRDESDWEGTNLYFAWLADSAKNALSDAVAALTARGYAFHVTIGYDDQVKPNQLSRKPTSAAAILNRIVATYLEDDDPTFAPERAEITDILAQHGFAVRDGKVR
jgi:hypothetical protein